MCVCVCDPLKAARSVKHVVVIPHYATMWPSTAQILIATCIYYTHFLSYYLRRLRYSLLHVYIIYTSCLITSSPFFPKGPTLPAFPFSPISP